MTARPVPLRHWRSYGGRPIGARVLIDPIGADRAGRVVAECLAIGLGGPKQS